MRIGFYAWNPFQIYQVESIVRHLPAGTAEYIVEKRGNIDFDRIFPRGFLNALNAPVRFIRRGDIKTIDENYDAVICQTAFGKMESLEKAKIISMQYSMSKERHQYGVWRTLCDLNLLYGQYSYDRVAPLSPSVMVGNPRFDRLFEKQLDPAKQNGIRASLNPAKKTVLYLPTWGDLSSIPAYGAAVAALSDNYNVIAKVHHKTDTHELGKKEILGEKGLNETFGASDDLLYLMEVADIVLSDYSGAIFDALNAGKPVVLLQKDPRAVIGAEKFGLESIEYARRHDIGPVVEDPARLAETIDAVLTNKIDHRAANDKIRAESFIRQTGCGKAAADAILDCLANPAPRPSYQIYLRDAIADARKAEENGKKAKKIQNIVNTNVSYLMPAKETWKKISRKFLRIHVFCVEMLSIPVVRIFWRDDRRAFFRKLVSFMSPLMHSSALVNLSQKYDQHDTAELAVIFAEAAFKKSRSNGLTNYIKTLDKYGKKKALRTLLDTLLALPLGKQGRLLSRMERLSSITKYRDKDVRKVRAAVFADIMGKVKNQRGRKALGNLEILISNRWLSAAAKLLPDAHISDKGKDRLKTRIQISHDRMKKWSRLTSLANKNRKPGLKKEDYRCLLGGENLAIAEVNGPVVEFMLPPYFYEEKVTNQAAHSRICAMLRQTLDVLDKNGIAIVPQHQFRLNDAFPSGHWPALSYHTTGNDNRWHHIKDAALPGFFSIDNRGYSGWASLATLETLPPAAPDDIEETWSKIQAEFVDKKLSKYEQQANPFAPPTRPFVFFPMQILTDTVAALAHIPSHTLALYLAELLPAHGYDLVIKRHPLCTDKRISGVLNRLKGKNGIHITAGSIHEILPTAAAVVTVNSGVGFESLFYGKKVILTGAADYAYATETVKNKDELEKALQKLDTPVDINHIKAFLHHYMTHYVVNMADETGLNKIITEKVLKG